MKQCEFKIIDTGKHIEEQLNALGAQGRRVVRVTTKKQLLIARPQAMREAEPAEGRALAPEGARVATRPPLRRNRIG